MNKKIELPKKRQFSNDSQYAQYDKGFNHGLMVCKDMVREQGFTIVEVDEMGGE